MPKVVDHEARRRELAEAVWRVVQRNGIAGATVRAVAAEAATTPGALRHYFASQEELIAFALAAVVDRATARAQRLTESDPRARAIGVLEQLLPLDDERRLEMAVYVEATARAHASPQLAAIRDEAQAAVRAAVELAIGLLHPDADAGREADVLFPLIDGLALHATQSPGRYPPAHLRRVLRAYLARLDPAGPSAR